MNVVGSESTESRRASGLASSIDFDSDFRKIAAATWCTTRRTIRHGPHHTSEMETGPGVR